MAYVSTILKEYQLSLIVSKDPALRSDMVGLQGSSKRGARPTPCLPPARTSAPSSDSPTFCPCSVTQPGPSSLFVYKSSARPVPLLLSSYLPSLDDWAQDSGSSIPISCIAQRGLVGVWLSFGDATGAIFAGYLALAAGFFIDAIAIGKALRKKMILRKGEIDAYCNAWSLRVDVL